MKDKEDKEKYGSLLDFKNEKQRGSHQQGFKQLLKFLIYTEKESKCKGKLSAAFTIQSSSAKS